MIIEAPKLVFVVELAKAKPFYRRVDFQKETVDSILMQVNNKKHSFEQIMMQTES